MGVKDLWQLLAPIGRRVSIETLEGKILAIDMSIWITQFIKAMRDDEGKMVRNAHIIGTIRRILRLLFHKIKPVFIFDGETPALKARVVKQRRKVHERHESNRKAAVHKMILNQLKQKLIEGMKETTDPKANAAPSKFAAGFILPGEEETQPMLHSSISGKNKSATAMSLDFEPSHSEQIIIDLENEDEIQWEEQKEFKPKALNDEDEADMSANEDEPSFDIPENYDELNVHVLSSLPIYMRKRIIEDARRKERMKSRSRYIPVAEDPSMYSQTQLANFLVTSKLNKRFEQAQQLIDGSDDNSRRIAAESNKRYRLTQQTTTSSLWNSSSKASVDDYSGANKNSDQTQSSINEQGEFDYSWMNDTAESEENANNDKDSGNFIAPSGGFFMNDEEGEKFILPSAKQKLKDRLAKLNEGGSSSAARSHGKSKTIEIDWTGLPITSKQKTVRFSASECGNSGIGSSLSHIENTSRSDDQLQGKDVDSDYGDGCGFFPEEVSQSLPDRIKEFTSNNTLEMKMHDSNEYAKYLTCDPPNQMDTGFYNNFHADEDGEIVDIDNSEIAWETVPEEEDKGIEICNNAVDDNLNVLAQPKCDIEEILSNIKEEDIVIVPSGASQISLQSEIGVVPTALQSIAISSPTKVVSERVLDRAVETASSMADWAGRAVRRALKDHLKSSKHHSTVRETSDDIIASSDLTVVDVENDEIYPSSPMRSDTQLENVMIAASETQSGGFFQESDKYEARIESSSGTLHPSHSRSLPSVTPHDVHSAGGFLSMYNETYDLDEEAKKAYLASSRDAEKMTEEMREDVMKLIQAFDLPFLIAPFEAEAQCAVLEELGIVDGVITEDSDAFLFGAKSVYKNIFSDKKFVEVYLAEDAKRELGLTRDDLIALAYFLGSDYTEGVHGVGIVNAMEIIQAFSMKDETGGPLNGLEKFRDWLKGYDFAKEILMGLENKQQRSKEKSTEQFNSTTGSRKENKTSTKYTGHHRHKNSADECFNNLNGIGDQEESNAVAVNETTLSNLEKCLIDFDAKHKSGRAKWTVPESFPDPKVAQAYFHPETNRSTDPFYWPDPSKEKLASYCRNVLGWSEDQINAQVDPVLQSFSKRTTQTRIDSHFMTYHDDNRFAKIASDRLRTAVIQITGKSSDSAVLQALPEKKKRKASKRKKSDLEDEDDQ